MTNSTTDYYDFCTNWRWQWVLQSLIFRDVFFYYDKRQKCYCRKIKNVKGIIKDGFFYPKHRLVKYKQYIF